jgi:uncharacterized membrane protein YccC
VVEQAAGGSTAKGASTRHILAWHIVYAVGMAVACLIAYWIALNAFASGFPKPSETIGAMWAAIAAAFVFRDSRTEALSAGIARLRATFVSFVLCQIYLSFFPPTAVGMAVIIGTGTLILTALRWRQDIITTAITTIVVVVLAQLDPGTAWYQPVLRFLDTLLGIAIGIACKWLISDSLEGRTNR